MEILSNVIFRPPKLQVSNFSSVPLCHWPWNHSRAFWTHVERWW